MTGYFTGQVKASRTLSGSVDIVRSIVITISVFISHCALFLLVSLGPRKKVVFICSTSTGWLHFSVPLYFGLREQATRQRLTCEQAPREPPFFLLDRKKKTPFSLLDRSRKRPSHSTQKGDRFSSSRRKRKTPFYLLNRNGNRLFLCSKKKGNVLLPSRQK